MVKHALVARYSELIDTYDYIYGIDKGASQLNSKGIKFDIQVGDFDSGELIDGYPSKILSPEKDVTDLNYVLNKLPSEDQKDLYAYGDRMDHWIVQIMKLIELKNVRIINTKNIIYKINSGSELQYHSGYKYISFFPITKNTRIDLINFKYNLFNFLMNEQPTLCAMNNASIDSEIVIHTGEVLVVHSND